MNHFILQHYSIYSSFYKLDKETIYTDTSSVILAYLAILHAVYLFSL